MSSYAIDGVIMDEHETGFQAALQALHSMHKRARCMCTDAMPEMYVACIGTNYILKRMPNKGAEHASHCESFALPDEVSGASQSMGSAIIENHDTGEVDIKVDFSLSTRKGPKPAKGTGIPKPTVKTKPNRLSLKALLHFLWEHSHLNRWVPKMKGKRSWGVVQRCLLQAATQIRVKGNSLTSVLLVPELYIGASREQVDQHFNDQVQSIAQNELGGVVMVVGELIEFAKAKFNFRLSLKGSTGRGIYLSEESVQQILKRFERECAFADVHSDIGSRVIVALTGVIAPSNSITIKEFTLMVVNADYLPIDTNEEVRLIQKLQEDDRWFTKPLRYDLPDRTPLAAAVLTELNNKPRAMYIVGAHEAQEFCADLDSMVSDSQLDSWLWDLKRTTHIPALDAPYERPLVRSTDNQDEDASEPEFNEGSERTVALHVSDEHAYE